MRYEIQTTGSLGIILLEIPFHRLIHTVPAQYTLICQSIVGFYVDPIRLGQPDPFAFDQADLFQFFQELHCFLLAAAHLFNDLIYRIVDEHPVLLIEPVVLF